jgi:TPR repeat protein
MYLNGEGVEQNRPLALAWFRILADSGNPMDQKRHDSLSAELSDAERDQATALVQEIRSRADAGQ